MKKMLALLAAIALGVASQANAAIALRAIVRFQNKATDPATFTFPMSWSVTGITQASSAVVTISSTSFVNPLDVGSQVNFSGVAGMTQINGLTGTVTAVAVVTSGTSYTITVNINSSAFSAYTSGGTAAVNLQQNDFMLGCWNVGQQTATATFPAGWTNSITGITAQNINGNQLTTSAGCAYKLAGASEPSSYSISTTSGSANDWAGFTIRIYSGVNTSTPLGVTPVTTTAVASAAFPLSLSLTGITAGSGDTLVLFVPFSGEGTASTFSFTPPTGFSNNSATVSVNAFYPFSSSADYIGNSGGLTGTLSASASYSGAGVSSGYAGFLFDLKPAGGSSCTHAGYTSAGAIATPNGTSGSYLGKTGAFVTPDCSTVQYWSPALGNFTTN